MKLILILYVSATATNTLTNIETLQILQILTIYDRFGRLIQRSEILKKDILEHSIREAYG